VSASIFRSGPLNSVDGTYAWTRNGTAAPAGHRSSFTPSQQGRRAMSSPLPSPHRRQRSTSVSARSFIAGHTGDADGHCTDHGNPMACPAELQWLDRLGRRWDPTGASSWITGPPGMSVTSNRDGVRLTPGGPMFDDRRSTGRAPEEYAGHQASRNDHGQRTRAGKLTL